MGRARRLGRGTGEWFSARPEPSYAIFGRHTHLPMAGLTIDKSPAFAAATRQLIELGHRRVVMLARKMIRLPEPGWCASLLLDELEAHGIPH